MDGPSFAARFRVCLQPVALALCATAFSGVLAGCSQHDPLPFPTYAVSSGEADVFATDKGNAFIDYTEAANALDGALGADAPRLLIKTTFSPAERVTIQNRAKAALHMLRPALTKSCHIPYVPPNSPDALKYRPEWRLLGRILLWYVQDGCEKNNLSGAIQYAVIATKFGFDLTNGSPRDASLGFVTADAVRQALASSAEKMTPEELTTMANAVKSVYLGRPSISTCMDKAGKDMMWTVQKIQDAYRSEDYGTLVNDLGQDAKDTVTYLKNLHQQSDQKRALFFDGFASEARTEADRISQEATQPAAARRGKPKGKQLGDRPWKRLAQRYFGLGDPILNLNDRTCARTQLLILEAQVLRSLKENGHTPADLNGFSRSLTVDPFSGESFVYRSDGKDFRLYSVGKDLIDNNGDTDETFTRPDLMIEHGVR